MKTVNVRNLQKNIRHCVSESQDDRIVITRNGKPAALIIGVEGADWESLVFQTSKSFWKMIETRRKEKTISVKEMKKLIERERAGET